MSTIEAKTSDTLPARPARTALQLVISAFAAVVLLAAATSILSSPSTERPVGSAGMMSLQELHAAASVNKLPIEDFEDLSLIYPTIPKR
jgi:hypothetical protein